MSSTGAGLASRSLVMVTGKGGVGKTTVAAALGLRAAAAGRRTIVCEVGDQRRLPRLFGVEDQHGEEVRLRDGLWSTSIDPEPALREWLSRQLGSRQLVDLLARSNLFQYFVAAAPGAKELVTVTKLWELAQAARWRKGAEAYDTVVVDLPASGHGVGLMRTARTFADVARVGPIANQAGAVRDAIEDPAASAMVAVCLPGELPVTETLDLEATIARELRRPVDAIVVNALLDGRFSPEEVAEVSALAGTAAGPLPGRAVRAQAGRSAAQHEQLVRLLEGADAPVSTLPFLPRTALGLADVELLAERLDAGL